MSDAAAGIARRAQRQSALRRMRWLATGLLLAMVALHVLARLLPPGAGRDLLAAFAEAAMVGALADWFAVVALFRHPLGLPIPHTAIVPRRKAQLADQLGEFVRDRFLDTEALLGRLRALDPIGHLGRWLAQPEHLEGLGERLRVLLTGLLDSVDDTRIRTLLHQAVQQRLESIDLARIAGDLLATLTADRRHQELLDQTLRLLAAWLDRDDVQKNLAGMLVELIGREYPRTAKLIGSFTSIDDIGQKIAAAAVRGLNGWLHDICDDPDHPRRAIFDAQVTEFIERLRTDAAFAERVNAIKLRLIRDPVVAGYVASLWDELRQWLHQDLQQPDSRLRRHLTDAAAHFGQAISRNEALRTSLQQHLEEVVGRLAPDLREGFASHIARTIKGWDDAKLVEELELGVGRDLQFIRINGTLVGGLIGVLIHLADLALLRLLG